MTATPTGRGSPTAERLLETFLRSMAQIEQLHEATHNEVLDPSDVCWVFEVLASLERRHIRDVLGRDVGRVLVDTIRRSASARALAVYEANAGPMIRNHARGRAYMRAATAPDQTPDGAAAVIGDDLLRKIVDATNAERKADKK